MVVASSREDAWIETVPQITAPEGGWVASSREDAWIETKSDTGAPVAIRVASSREDAWIETDLQEETQKFETSRPPARTRGLKPDLRCDVCPVTSRVLPRGRVD